MENQDSSGGNSQTLEIICQNRSESGSTYSVDSGDIERDIFPESNQLLEQTGACIIVKPGETTIEVNYSNVLDIFWGGGLDSTCMVCENGFVEDNHPPIRTMSLYHAEDTNNLMSAAPLLRIYNRHMECIQAQGLDYIPISHVWHQCVADAHESRTANPEAVRVVLEIPYRILIALVTEYGQNIEIWHDYISIPQWQDDCQQRLLVVLPNIFGSAPFAVVHMDDVPFKKIKYVYGSRWNYRMWVMLEYGRSKNAFVLTREYRVWPVALPELFGRIIMQNSKLLSLEKSDFELAVDDFGPRDEKHTLASNNRSTFENCNFGFVINRFWLLKCRTYRDRWIAACALIFPDAYTDLRSWIPRDPTDACLFVAKECLLEGTIRPYFSALQKMLSSTWKFGIELQSPETLVVFRRGTIVVDLEPVGAITNVFYQALPKSWRADIDRFFFAVVKMIVKKLGTGPRDFNITIQQLYGALTFDKRETDFPVTIEEYPQQNQDFKTKLHSLLLQRELVMRASSERTRSIDIGYALINLLKLNDIHRGGSGTFTRLMRALEYQHATHICWAFVECEGCDKKSLFKVDMWEDFRGLISDVRLFRIPGLGFSGSFANGVGLVISEKRIVGRMMFGKPTCECEQRQSVEII